MNSKLLFISFICVYLIFCGFLFVESGIFKNFSNDKGCILLQNSTETQKPKAADVNKPANETMISRALPEVVLGAKNAEPNTVIIGAKDPKTENPETGFKLQLKLNTKGASIEQVTFSNGKNEEGERLGFDDRDPNNPKPFVLLKPTQLKDGSKIFSLSNGELVFVDREKQLPLNKLDWNFEGLNKAGDGGEKAEFTALIFDQTSGNNILKVSKTFFIDPGSYLIKCDVNVENLWSNKQKIRFNMNGAVGPTREGVRSDMRNIITAYKNKNGEIVSNKLEANKMRKADSMEDLLLSRDDGIYLWGAVTNKYFAAITVPLADEGKDFCEWLGNKYGHYYNPDGDSKGNSGDETIGLEMKIAPVTLGTAGADNSSKEYSFDIYLGPKDKKLFDENEYYKKLGFYHSINFMACCCPKGIIQPLAFFIMWLMNSIFTFIPNYGVVIIILVFIVRVILHPLTKAGQVRMNKFTKIMSSPEIQEIKNKYSKNHVEMQKRMSEFYKARGTSPMDMFWGMIPTMAQMPIWISLWTSVNSSINLRGAGFLPFWITDLSVPDALISWPTVTLPLIGWQISSLNLLPILMGVAFYMQQKMMPQQAAATPEQAQQQKMMKVMMLVMFPVLLYKAPSGVSLYIMASSFAGAIEQYIIRKHIREKEEEQSRGIIEVTSKTGGKVKKKKPKPFIKY